MKRMPLLVLTIIIFSCEKKPETSNTYILRFGLDTVMVDAGDEILYLEMGLQYSTLSPDGRYLYNFNKYDHSLEKLDLEELRLVEKLPFEKEGPNGTGNYIDNIDMLDQNHIHMSSFWTLGQFQLDGTRTKKYDLINLELNGAVLNEYEVFKDNIIIPGHPEILFVLVSNWKEKTYNLRKLDFRQKQITKYEIDPENKIPKFSFQIPTLSKDTIIGPHIELSVENGHLIISSDITNEIHIYDPIGDSLISKKNNLRLTSNEKKGKFPGVYASMEELMVDYQKVLEEISFSPPVWDKENEQYYRFSYMVYFEEEKEPGAMLPNNKRTHVFLSIYDKDFTIMTEAPVPQLVINPVRYFVREGDIWIFENIEDDLGFVRLSLR